MSRYLYVEAGPWYSMASKETRQPTDADELDIFPDWVYQIPGLVLIAVGFGGVVYLSLF